MVEGLYKIIIIIKYDLARTCRLGSIACTFATGQTLITFTTYVPNLPGLC